MPDANSDIETGDKSHKKFSRRDFLKLGGLAGPAIALGLSKPETTKPNNDILSIETQEAKYFPIYETHQQPVSGEELKLLPPQDVFLYEYFRDTRYFVDSPPQVILDTPIPISTDSKRDHVVPRNHLEWLKKNSTKICFEGYVLPTNYFLIAELVMFGEPGIALGSLLLPSVFSKPKENRGKRMDRRQFLKLAAGLAATWGLSSGAYIGLEAFGKTDVKESALERTMIKAQGLLSHTHPENPIVFFRNIMLARKLQFLGEAASKEKGQKAQITYNVGKAHAGIEDFLLIGKDWTLNFLNIMPNQFLKKVIDRNGGLENFCSNVLVDPNAQRPTKSVLVDQELKNFLNKKLGLSS